jgi:hypothetical protein
LFVGQTTQPRRTALEAQRLTRGEGVGDLAPRRLQDSADRGTRDTHASADILLGQTLEVG